jgi:hypothetical protein
MPTPLKYPKLPVKVQFNISNVTDEVYFHSIYGGTSRIVQGTPRVVWWVPLMLLLIFK